MSDSCVSIWNSGDKTEDKTEISVVVALNSPVNLKSAGVVAIGELCRDEVSAEWTTESKED